MPKQKWFDRKFSFIPGPEIYPLVVERLCGTAARLQERVHGMAQNQLLQQIDGRWSIQENIGHLADLAPLWTGRLQDFAEAAETLRAADLKNTATFAAQHNKPRYDGFKIKWGGTATRQDQWLVLVDKPNNQQRLILEG